MLWLSQTGPGMTAAEIDFIAGSPLPLERDRSGGGLRGVSSFSYDFLFPVIGPAASVYLTGSGLIAPVREAGTFKITEQGVALLRGIIRQDETSGSVFKLDPDAPLDYIALLSELDTLEDPLVIDPYFHPYDFAGLVDALPGVTLLTINREVAKVEAFDKPKLSKSLKRGQFEEALGKLAGAEVESKVIYADPSALHDRYFLGSNRQGYFAGGSFRSGKSTVVMDLEADHAAELYEKYRGVAGENTSEQLTPRIQPAVEHEPSV